MSLRLVFVLLIALAGTAAADSFEFLAYTPPPATWVKQVHPTGAVSYTAASGVGMILLVPSVTPIGTPIEEFETYWRANVEPIVKAPLPKAQSRPARDLTMVWGSSRVTRGAQTVDVQVVMFVGRGSVLGTVTLTTNAASVRDVAAFNASVKVLDENRPIAKQPEPAEAARPALAPAPIAPTPAAGSIAFDYVAPPGFGKTKTQNGITALLHDGGTVRDTCMFALYPPLPSSGDLDRDVASALQTVPAGWKPPGASFVTQQRGVGPTGWPYAYKTATVSPAGGAGRSATVLAIGLWAPKNQVSFVYGFGGADCPLEAGLETLFHTLVPRGFPPDGGSAFRAALAKKAWREYAFHASGRYQQESAKVDGTWKLAGSTLLLSPDGGGTKETLRVRVVSDLRAGVWRDAIVVLADKDVRMLHERESAPASK